MGLLNKIISKGPGGPANVAKAMIKAYNSYRADNPDEPLSKAMEYAITTRYHTIKKMSLYEMGYYLGCSESLGDIITAVIYKEIPMAFSRDFLDSTFLELENVYRKFAPEELSSLERIPHILQMASDFKYMK